MQSNGHRSYQVGKYIVDLEHRSISFDGRRVNFGWRQFEALRLLIEASGSPVEKEQFLRTLWGGEFVDESNLTKCIASLRKGLNQKDSDHDYVETVPRIGYRLAVDVQPVTVTVAEPVRGLNRNRLWMGVAAAVALLAISSFFLSQWWQARDREQRFAAAVERGRNLYREGNGAAAAREFELALRIKPKSALIYSELAHALHKSARAPVERADYRTPSVEAAERGVSLDPKCATCQGTLGYFLFYHGWRWKEAEQHLLESIRLDPEAWSVRPAYALLLAATGRSREALEQIDAALKHRPFYASWHGMRAAILYMGERYSDAIAAADKAILMQEGPGEALEWRSRALFQVGRQEEAVRAQTQGVFTAFAGPVDLAIGQAGWQGGLRKLLELTGDWQSRRNWSWRRASWHLLLGDSTRALESLELARQLRTFPVIYIAADPGLAPLRNEPRFRQIVEAMGLPLVHGRRTKME